eukprot:TRINITY_DN40167_c0_g1_i1.p1 TRINITY_DN40167_c0_g1~~TRINITY_DN40167_c0_g1_i1.p1  ORF type:complete len:217 (-),score=32.56 TRINITY_DN40167_c0_g1_i1:133-783(-)
MGASLGISGVEGPEAPDATSAHDWDSDPDGNGPMLQGVTEVGGKCTCQVPPISIPTLQYQDREWWSTLDGYTSQALLRRKPEGEANFAMGLERFNHAKHSLDDVGSRLQHKYTELAMRRRDLEQEQQWLSSNHFTKCRPLATKYGLHLPCSEDYREAMRRYRSLEEKPTCVIGASLPLRPASLGLGLTPLDGEHFAPLLTMGRETAARKARVTGFL